ncbi:MAG TPA: bifunctional DNA-formamidopyrimidine glycosylase/DNA-(apurinic or apyrimidinic site) lyase [Thermoanaerobaculia bacterium]|nr:bifunctional DNA-formamidopyrimidine glycosylase/DNA-(apurinic or apyrimidinic site) lyase [Thermoanaerobaculia bacterium]
MPELPEVEVLRRSLEARVLGDRVESVAVRFPTLREPISAPVLRRRLAGRRIERLRRRAKYLLMDVEGGSTLVVHLGMSGRLLVVPAGEPSAPHEHVVISLASGRTLRFRDPRRFGLLLALPTGRIERDRHFRHLGVEPLESGFDGARLAAKARGRFGPVKSFLMDAAIVVGVGNIYACEALHLAGIHPARSVARISQRRFDGLASAVRDVLGRAIAEGGTTLNDFADADGEPGYFAVSLHVYGREGEPCLRCGAIVRRIVQSNRSTFYCPRCQR